MQRHGWKSMPPSLKQISLFTRKRRQKSTHGWRLPHMHMVLHALSSQVLPSIQAAPDECQVLSRTQHQIQGLSMLSSCKYCHPVADPTNSSSRQVLPLAATFAVCIYLHLPKVSGATATGLTPTPLNTSADTRMLTAFNCECV